LEYESPVEAASTNLGFVITGHIAIRASMKHLQDYDNSVNIVTSLCALDNEYQNWTKELPPEFVFTETSVDPPCKEVFGNYYYTYSSIWIANVWNHYRCARILANELIRDQISHLMSHENHDPLQNQSIILDNEQVTYETILAKATSTIRTLSNEMVNSVPFYLSPNTPDAPRALVGNLILWPLYLASQTTTATDEMRVWAAERLGYIHETMGVLQAAPMAQSLKRMTSAYQLYIYDRQNGGKGMALREDLRMKDAL